MAASGIVSIALVIAKKHVWPGELAWMTNQVILVITVTVSTVVWLTVTLATAPVSKAKLVAFYRKVRPYGAWGRIAAESAITPPAGLGRMLTNWLAGSVMVLAATFSLGKFLLCSPIEGALYLAAATAGAAVVWRELRSTSARSG